MGLLLGASLTCLNIIVLNFIVYDLEATCWKGAPPNDVQEIIEIGAIKLNGFGEELGSFNKFVRPKVNQALSAFCKELTGIDQQQVDRAGNFDMVIENFFDWGNIFEEDYLLISWGKEDQSLLRNDCQLHDIESDWLHPHLNLKNAYQALKRLRKPTGLRKTLDIEGFEFDGSPHRAIDDAVNTVKIFRQYVDEWPY